MKIHAPDMAFRGTRNYLHSTDLYEEVLAGSELTGVGVVDGPVMLKFRRKLTAQPELCFLTSGETVEATSAEFLVTVRAQQVRGVIRETGCAVSRRCEYDERAIWNASEISDGAITGRPPGGATAIEVVTALGVLYHRTAFPPPSGTRWMLARIDVDRPLNVDELQPVTITLRQHVGHRMTRSTVIASLGFLGTMEFILARG